MKDMVNVNIKNMFGNMLLMNSLAFANKKAVKHERKEVKRLGLDTVFGKKDGAFPGH